MLTLVILIALFLSATEEAERAIQAISVMHWKLIEFPALSASWGSLASSL